MNPALQEQILVAGAYEQLHVPALFREWVGPVLDAARVSAGQRVLDVACGTGVLARGAREQVGPAGEVVGLDPNPGMLAVAREIDASVEWREGTAETLPFPNAEFDAVVSQFGMMFFPDPAAAVREMYRVLAPGGTMAVAVWDVIERHPAYALEVELLERVAGREAADALCAPFVLGDRDSLAGVFEQAGVPATRIITRTGTARFPSIRVMVEADLRGWLPVMGVTLPEDQIARILAEAERVLSGFIAPNGEVRFDSPAHIAVGRREGEAESGYRLRKSMTAVCDLADRIRPS